MPDTEDARHAWMHYSVTNGDVGEASEGMSPAAFRLCKSKAAEARRCGARSHGYRNVDAKQLLVACLFG